MPEARVLVVEGEKAADAARELLGTQFAVTTWSGGSSAVRLADWSPLSGRDITIWPDADVPGIKAADLAVEKLREAGARRILVVTVGEQGGG